MLHEQWQVINPWQEPVQVEEVVKQLTTRFSANSHIENCRYQL